MMKHQYDQFKQLTTTYKSIPIFDENKELYDQKKKYIEEIREISQMPVKYLNKFIVFKGTDDNKKMNMDHGWSSVLTVRLMEDLQKARAEQLARARREIARKAKIPRDPMTGALMIGGNKSRRRRKTKRTTLKRGKRKQRRTRIIRRRRKPGKKSRKINR